MAFKQLHRVSEALVHLCLLLSTHWCIVHSGSRQLLLMYT